MTIKLEKLVSKSKTRSDATIVFDTYRTLIRGPSDTGKSYIRDCLWYLLGGEKVPKTIPQSESYDFLLLQIKFDNQEYTIKRSLKASSSIELYRAEINSIHEKNKINKDVNEFLVECAGAKDKIVVRSKSKNGPITGGDLRHWFLLSQPAMISEDATYGKTTERTQRKASFYTFLTGLDDSDRKLDQSKDEKLKINTSLEMIENHISRLRENLPDNFNKADVENSLLRIDSTFDFLNKEQKDRATELREVRKKLHDKIFLLDQSESNLTYAQSMLSRFQLLNDKYDSDLDRLNAVDSSLAIFKNLEKQACVLCRVIVSEENSQLSELDIFKQRQAINAESNKIKLLQQGLKDSIVSEVEIVNNILDEIATLNSELNSIKEEERNILSGSCKEEIFDIKELAIKRTEWSSLLNIDNEIQRLAKQYDKLEGMKEIKTPPITRQLDTELESINKVIKSILHSWGFAGIHSIHLDIMECDIKIDGRDRLSYGAGKRSIFLAALAIGLLSYSIDNKHPNLGCVIIDSPLKSYADPNNVSDVTVPVKTVRDSFYKWLADWNGAGQLIVLENEMVSGNIYDQLKPIEFTGIRHNGRYGFYPES